MKAVLVFLSLVALGYGHLCLFAPPQRGSMEGVNTAGATDCFLTKGPCGERRPAHDAVVFPKNENITVTFMKNLDHYNKTAPGKFVISLMEPQGGKTTILGTIPDGGEPSLHIYTTHVQPPANISTEVGPHILQVVYQPNSSGAPAAFYQCADVGFGPK